MGSLDEKAKLVTGDILRRQEVTDVSIIKCESSSKGTGHTAGDAAGRTAAQ